MACTPRLEEEGHEWQRAAAVSLAYNIGVGAYCKSSIDKRFDEGNWKQGCNNFILYNKARVNGILRPVTGLTNRRKDEIKTCLKGLS
jgi:lysozyme